jgi:cytochrome c peroxidase
MRHKILVLIGSMIGLNANANTRRQTEPIQPIAAVQPAEPAKVELGKLLFFEPRLSKSGFISCNSCHNLSTGGADNLPSSIGHKWSLGPINSPTVLNARYNLAQFWDGRAKDLVEQAGGPVANPGEMASTHELAVSVLSSIPGYASLFKDAFGTSEVSIARVQSAIAAFEETLITPDSRFDRWLGGDDRALAKDELAGYQIFKERGCVSCHNGPALGGNSFQKMGLVKAYASDSKAQGRYDVTKNDADRMFFKVPTLRNIELTYPYFHDGSVWTLEEAVSLMGRHQLGIELSKDEVAKLTSFLKTLTGRQPQIAIPILPPSGKTTPRPQFG